MILVLIVGLVIVSAIAVAGALIRRSYFFQKQIERSLKLVPVLITLPRSLEDASGEDNKKIIAKAEAVFGTLAGIYQERLKSKFFGQKHVAFEVVARGRQLAVYAAVPITLLDLVEKAITGQYPEASVEEVEEHNIFAEGTKLKQIAGLELRLKRHPVFPIKTYQELETDPFESITNALSKLEDDEGAALQVLVRPAGAGLVGRARRLIRKIGRGQAAYLGSRGAMLSFFHFFGQAARGAKKNQPGEKGYQETDQDRAMIAAITKKTAKPIFETTIRIIASSKQQHRSEALVNEIAASFQQLSDPLLNGFTTVPQSSDHVATNFIWHLFPPSPMRLNIEELATIFHLPEQVDTPFVKQQASRQAPAPVELPSDGLTLGDNQFRNDTREVRLRQDDKRRHAYIIGQTGTGKSTLLENMIVQEITSGAGVAVIDPHGDLVEKIIGKIPKERAEDVIYFDPSDLDQPLGVNLFEWKTPDQKDLLINELLNMLYKLYDPGKTGIIGPRFEHWLRNGVLTLMADPAGATILEVPKIFTDKEFLKQKLKYVTDPLVLDFWTKEMAQTSDFHKSEILGWFVSKFGAFISNETMRNILGQTKSAFDIREVMDGGKILLVNLSKGRIGETNSSLLGMIFVTKIQLAAMSRVDTDEAQRRDFTLYVDEFQNFSTDSFASILSEARKYRLALIVANQFIGQLRDEIRDAVFGNVGTLVSYRIGASDAEFMIKQFEPQFKQLDLINLENYHAVLKLMIDGVPSKPFSLSAWPPLGERNTEIMKGIKELSRLKYGAKREIVEQDIRQRLSSMDSSDA